MAGQRPGLPGDGEQILHAINPQTGKAIIRDGRALVDFTEARRAYKAGQLMPCPGLDRDIYPKCEFCKPNAILVVMLRDIPRLAYYQITTTSINNILDIPAQLDYVRQQVEKLSLTGTPRITGVPFILRRVKRSISVPNLDKNGNRKTDKNGKLLPAKQRTEKYFLEIEIEPEWIAKMIRGLARLSNPMAGAGLLPAAVEEVEQEPPAVSHFSEPPQWEPRDYDDAVIEGDSVDIDSDPDPSGGWFDEEAPQAKNSSDKMAGPVQALFDRVQDATDGYYKNAPHLCNTIGGWPEFNDPDDIDAKFSAAVDHVKRKNAPADEVQFVMDMHAPGGG